MNSAETLTQPETPHTANPNSNGDATAPRAVDWDNPRVAAILTAAAKCFARKGFSATTLAEIGKELGLRKSIVHYYFASKAALIHEVQSFTQHRYLEKVRDSIRGSGDGSKQRMVSALGSLWTAVQENKTATGLAIEVWAAARRDPELKKRAANLQHDARALIGDGIGDVLGVKPGDFQQMEALSALILGVLNGLAVSEQLEGPAAKTEEAYQLFLYLLRLGLKSMETRPAQA
jgi:TetR/AcrR family transcriptional regulator, repressor for uid operon